MKIKVLASSLYLLLAILLVSFSDPYTIKRVSDVNFRYEFYTTDKKVSPKENKIYYWFKGGAIHNAQSGIAGALLHDKYIKMYHSNQLAEQGAFRNGLKIGVWKTWFANGIIETIQNWNNGLKSGTYYRYDEKGTLAEKGNYKADKKHGLWFDYVKKDTVTYKRGVIVVKKRKLSKEEKDLLKEEKKKTKEAKKALKAAEKVAKKHNKEVENSTKIIDNKTKKDGFFKRLFSKLHLKRNKTNGQGK